MKFLSTTSILLFAPLLASAAPAGEQTMQKRACVVNALNTETWHEAGLTRRKTSYSSDPPELCNQFCSIFKKKAEAPGLINRNYACWQNENGWQVDSSYALGVAGDKEYYDAVSASITEWKNENGCTTG